MIKNTPKDELAKLVKDALADPDLRQYPYLDHLLKYPDKNPILFDFMLNKLDGPYYRERSVSERLDKIKVPTYVGGPLFSFFSQPQINVFNRVDVPKKMFLYTDMGTRPWQAHHDELLRWYDYWLKGIETGIMDEPPSGTTPLWPRSGPPRRNGRSRTTNGPSFYLNSSAVTVLEPELLQRRAGRVRAGAALRDREEGAGHLREPASVRRTSRSPDRRGSPSTPPSTRPTPTSEWTCARRAPTPSILWLPAG